MRATVQFVAIAHRMASHKRSIARSGDIQQERAELVTNTTVCEIFDSTISFEYPTLGFSQS